MEIKAGKFVAATYDLYVGGEGEERELMEKATAAADAALLPKPLLGQIPFTI